MMPRKKKKESSVKTKGKKGGVAVQHQTGTINPIVGAAVGAAVGGVLGAAAAVALSDKETRERLKTAAANIRDQAADRMEHMRSASQDVIDTAKNKAQEKLASPDKKKS